MIPAKNSKRFLEKTKLMIVAPKELVHTEFGRLEEYLNPGDVLVVNTSSTLPSSFTGRVALSSGRFTKPAVELRLAAFRGETPSDLSRWAAISFGAGDWRTPTEKRGPPPVLGAGDRISLGDNLTALITGTDPRFPRLLEIKFLSSSLASNLVQKLYELGRPIQYSYLEKNLETWDQQTLFSGPPISVEPPSASFPMTWGQLLQLRQRGIQIATLLHSAGISSSGDDALDRLFPLEEYFEIPLKTHQLISAAKNSGHRVVALGTTAVRALESAYNHGFQSRGYTHLKLGPGTVLKVTDALITGMHAEGTSHGELMKAFCDCASLAQAEKEAESKGYRSHEYGDLTLLNCGKPTKNAG